jgi:cell shape-determining protein MreC
VNKEKTVTLELTSLQAHLVRMALEVSLRNAKMAVAVAIGSTRQVIETHVSNIEALLLMPFSTDDMTAEFQEEHKRYQAIQDRLEDIRTRLEDLRKEK